MKALVVTENHRLELRDVPAPSIGRFEALVKIEACGICSTTDSEIIRGTQPYHQGYPCLLGHEAVGTVIDVGAGVKRFKVGDRVTRPTGIWPGTARDGLVSGWGGFCELGLVRDRKAIAEAGDLSAEQDYTAPRQNVVPPQLSVSEAVLSIALAETLSWARHLPPLNGRHVCVAGTGIAGLSIVIWARMMGAQSITCLGRRESRLALARELGADHGVNVRERDAAAAVKELTNGGAHAFLEAAGQPDQVRVGCSLLRPGGVIAVYGVPPHGQYELDWRWMPGDVRFLRPPAEEHLAYEDVVKLLAHGKVQAGKLLTHQWPLAEFAQAFEAVGQGDVVKSLLVMPD